MGHGSFVLISSVFFTSKMNDGKCWESTLTSVAVFCLFRIVGVNYPYKLTGNLLKRVEIPYFRVMAHKSRQEVIKGTCVHSRMLPSQTNSL